MCVAIVWKKPLDSGGMSGFYYKNVYKKFLPCNK